MVGEFVWSEPGTWAQHLTIGHKYVRVIVLWSKYCKLSIVIGPHNCKCWSLCHICLDTEIWQHIPSSQRCHRRHNESILVTVSIGYQHWGLQTIKSGRPPRVAHVSTSIYIHLVNSFQAGMMSKWCHSSSSNQLLSAFNWCGFHPPLPLKPIYEWTTISISTRACKGQASYTSLNVSQIHTCTCLCLAIYPIT